MGQVTFAEHSHTVQAGFQLKRHQHVQVTVGCCTLHALSTPGKISGGSSGPRGNVPKSRQGFLPLLPPSPAGTSASWPVPAQTAAGSSSCSPRLYSANGDGWISFQHQWLCSPGTPHDAPAAATFPFPSPWPLAAPQHQPPHAWAALVTAKS